MLRQTNPARWLLFKVLESMRDAQLTAAVELKKMGASPSAQDVAVNEVIEGLKADLSYQQAINFGIAQGWSHELTLRKQRGDHANNNQ